MHAYVEAPEPRPKDQVRLPNGEFVTGKRVRPRNYPKIPAYLSRNVPGVARAQVEVGFIVDEQGILWQPVIVSAQALPIHAFLALCFVGEWRFFPAVVDGALVASAYSMTVAVEAL
jgi:hypothetical protein